MSDETRLKWHAHSDVLVTFILAHLCVGVVVQVLSMRNHSHLGTSLIIREWSSDSQHQYLTLTYIWTASGEFGTYRLCEQRRFRRACAFAQSRQNLRCSLIQAVSQEEPSDRKPAPWPLWMAGHAQLKFVMTECSKTQIHLMRPISRSSDFTVWSC